MTRPNHYNNLSWRRQKLISFIGFKLPLETPLFFNAEEDLHERIDYEKNEHREEFSFGQLFKVIFGLIKFFIVF